MKKLSFLAITLSLFSSSIVDAQNSDFIGLEHLFTQPLDYVVAYTHNAPIIDGNINDEVWEKAEWTSSFQDIEGDLKPKPYYDTKAKMLWDDNYLYIAAELKDEHVWSYLKNHDEVVFFDNDFEVFIDPGKITHRYFEIEINALNTIFDLFLPKPYRTGSGALIGWDSNGLKHAVQIYGSLNNPNDKDQGWTVEMAIPFKDITIGNNPDIPKDGSIWRLNFSRVQWETEIINGSYVKKKDANGKSLPENNWVWSPQGIIDMHAPERWGYIQFTKNEVGTTLPHFEMPYTELQRQYLWLVYYKQNTYKQKNGKYAKTLKELGIVDSPIIDNKKNKLNLESTSNEFSASISLSDDGVSIQINQEGYIN